MRALTTTSFMRGMTAMATPILAAPNNASKKYLQWQITGRKTCPKCRVEKPLCSFYLYKNGPRAGKPYSYCKDCEHDRARRKPRKTPIRFESDTHRECRKCGEVKPKDSLFYKTTKSSGVGGYSIYCKPCQLANTSASRIKSGGAWYRRQWERIKSDPRLHLKQRALGLVRKSLEGRFKYKKTGSVTSDFWGIVGYTQEELFDHIERQFLKGMSLSNMSQWHIDHIIPDSSFEYQSMNCPGFKQSWALANLRPLWGRENAGKGASMKYLI